MSDPLTVALNVTLHRTTGGVSTHLTLPNAAVTITVARNISDPQMVDLTRVLDRILPLMNQVWADPGSDDGPRVLDLRSGDGTP